MRILTKISMPTLEALPFHEAMTRVLSSDKIAIYERTQPGILYAMNGNHQRQVPCEQIWSPWGKVAASEATDKMATVYPVMLRIDRNFLLGTAAIEMGYSFSAAQMNSNDWGVLKLEHHEAAE